jgi:hypothetical protein
MIKFCSDCGKKVEYKYSPPKFCSDCGSPIGVAHVNESSPISRKVKKAVAINDDETDSEFVPQLKKLEYEIDSFGAEVQQTLGSLAGKSLPSKRKNNIKTFDDLQK